MVELLGASGRVGVDLSFAQGFPKVSRPYCVKRQKLPSSGLISLQGGTLLTDVTQGAPYTCVKAPGWKATGSHRVVLLSCLPY